MGNLLGKRPTTAKVVVPPAPPGSGQFAGIPAPIDFSRENDNPLYGSGGGGPTTPYPSTSASINFGDDPLGSVEVGPNSVESEGD